MQDKSDRLFETRVRPVAVGLYKGSAHGVDSRGTADVEFKDGFTALHFMQLTDAEATKLRDAMTDPTQACVVQIDVIRWVRAFDKRTTGE